MANSKVKSQLEIMQTFLTLMKPCHDEYKEDIFKLITQHESALKEDNHKAVTAIENKVRKYRDYFDFTAALLYTLQLCAQGKDIDTHVVDEIIWLYASSSSLHTICTIIAH